MIEILIVAALVIWSAVVVFKKVFPKTAYAFFLSLSNVAQKQGWTAIAKRLKTAMVAGCGGSCGCSSTDAPTEKKSPLQAVKWK